MAGQIDLNSLRAHKARLAKVIGPNGYRLLIATTLALLLIGWILMFVRPGHDAKLLAALGLLSLMVTAWYHQDLKPLPPDGDDLNSRLSGDILGCLKPKQPLTPQNVWQATSNHWQIIFLTNHLLLTPDVVKAALSQQEADMPAVWDKAGELAGKDRTIEPGHVAAALLASPPIKPLLTNLKLADSDVDEITAWLERALDMMRAEKPYFGGIGRDWAHGFTPRLNRFGRNISLLIEQHGGHFGALTSSVGVTAMKNAFGQGASAIALVGPPGIGKTSHVYALAQLLLAEDHNPNLEHRQVMALNPSLIISSARAPGDLEAIVMSLMQETAHAGHIVLFFDDAQLFFANGPGSFDITQILLSVIQSRAVQLVLAMTPDDYQKLKAERSAFAALLTPVVLTERPELEVMRVLEDTALNFEGQHNVLITYDALRAAYRLSGRYDQDTAYPGKAIQLLEQAIPYGQQSVIMAAAVEQAVEQAHGVKVGSAAPVEADALLNLEAKIHERMINQTRAVSVVSAALRRNRAGVANPKRPIGSFLFLGPTGVGKTELAKAIAAVYFKSETNMVRIDMSEYQQADDVHRLLGEEAGSLIMAVRQQPFTVLLLDEVEKAHPNILNLLLQMLDEGQLTDTAGRRASFKDCIIIATSNAGADIIRSRIEKGESLESFEKAFTDELINSQQFKPELLNRFDEIVLFRPLRLEELLQVVGLMMNEVNQTLAAQKISVELTPTAVQKIVDAGYDPRLGARPMRRVLQRAVEDVVADKILKGEAKAGDHITLDVKDLQL
jgi:ATP-dependent Clp protease ATP-binding subunit ClpC